MQRCNNSSCPGNQVPDPKIFNACGASCPLRSPVSSIVHRHASQRPRGGVIFDHVHLGMMKHGNDDMAECGNTLRRPSRGLAAVALPLAISLVRMSQFPMAAGLSSFCERE